MISEKLQFTYIKQKYKENVHIITPQSVGPIGVL